MVQGHSQSQKGPLSFLGVIFSTCLFPLRRSSWVFQFQGEVTYKLQSSTIKNVKFLLILTTSVSLSLLNPLMDSLKLYLYTLRLFFHIFYQHSRNKQKIKHKLISINATVTKITRKLNKCKSFLWKTCTWCSVLSGKLSIDKMVAI